MAVDQTPLVVPAPAPDETGRPPGRFERLYGRLTERPFSLYATAFLRIGYGLLFPIILLREFPNRHMIWGPEAAWSADLARRMFDQNGWFSVLTLSDDPFYFELCYLAAILVSVLFMLGWHTRVTSVLFAVAVVSFYSRAVLMSDGGDNLMVLMVMYMMFTACGRRWSLDARRKGTAGPRPGFREFVVTVLHNCALFVMMAQMCILYGAAGLYKVQGETWGAGTALHYVFKQDLFRPWPALSDFLDGHHVMIALACYMTVLVQVAFPFSLFSKLKYVVLPILIGMHLGIAFLMALPMFSAVMVLSDLVFLPDRFYRWAARTGRRLLRRDPAPSV
ncbi:HTTM domain-containing protein [Actinoplanes sp. NPDC026670]|uniref:HTTM domain-containing protein n=1 Tax=Actinoplanes sp. NPDC026670 TaxID=3154700 RepID=UPI0033EF06C0